MPVLQNYKHHSPAVDASAYLAPTATVVGAVSIGQESSIWHGAVLRGDVEPISVGARTSIQDNSVVHSTGGWQPARIGDDVTVGHSVVVHGCTIADRVLVGMGSLILDAAEIGSDVIIGAGSLITARTVIPPGSMVFGRPAKIVRPLSDEERSYIMISSTRYVDLGRDYLAAPVG